MRIPVWLGGRATAIPLARLDGLGTPLILARLLGRESPPAAETEADGLKPKLSREAGPSFVFVVETEALGLLREERTVTEEGMSRSERGEARGGVVVGAGSLECARWTRCSSVCILVRREWMWPIAFEVVGCGSPDKLGRPPPPMEGRVVVRFGAAEVGPCCRTAEVAVGIDGPRECRGGRIPLCSGRGVVPGSSTRLFAGVTGGASFVVNTTALASLSGGLGGLVCTVLVSLLGGGVATVGLEMVVAVVLAPDSLSGGLCDRRPSVMTDTPWPPLGFRRPLRAQLSSARRSFSCVMSASTLRSLSSSRSRCVSMRRASRSWSPLRISSSSSTPRSMALLYLDSMSSSDDVWWRACFSKSSLATSMSRSLSVRARLVSRRVVISFCSTFWARFASSFACLCLACGWRVYVSTALRCS